MLVFPLVLRNIGKRAAEQVRLEIVFPTGVCVAEASMSLTGLLPGAEQSRALVGERVHAYYYFPFFNPGETMLAEEPFRGIQTVNLKHEVRTETKDGHHVKVGVTYSFALIFDVVAYSKEDPPQSTGIEVFIFQASTFLELAQAWSSHEQEREIKTSSILTHKWLKHLLRRDRVLLSLPVFKFIEEGERRLLMQDYGKSGWYWTYLSVGKWRCRYKGVSFRVPKQPHTTPPSDRNV